MRKIFYYSDMQTDDFGTTVKRIEPLPKRYRYVHKNVLFRLGSFVLYRLVMRPLVFLYVKLRFGHKWVGKEKLRRLDRGFFVYGNHTLLMGDAFIPNLLSVRRRNYIITGAQANSLTALLPLMNSLGLIPLGENVAQNVQMLKCVKQRIGEGASVTIYPEAHVWPYYTDIRPFAEDSFQYAAMLHAPVVSMTTCFQKRRFWKTPRAVTYLDGPFYPVEGKGIGENARELRDQVYQAMCARAATHSTYSLYLYLPKEKEAVQYDPSK